MGGHAGPPLQNRHVGADQCVGPNMDHNDSPTPIRTLGANGTHKTIAPFGYLQKRGANGTHKTIAPFGYLQKRGANGVPSRSTPET